MKKCTASGFLLLVALLTSFCGQVFSQEIVVNEYFNGGGQSQEWTELVVVKDDLDLRGWFLGDNNTGTSSWQPKIQFANHALWNHLRAGTIILVNHAANTGECASQPQDFDKADGYIRVCCRNSTYFEGGTSNTLFLADEGDFVQIVDPTGKMVHGIGHDDDPGSSVEGGQCFTTSANWTNTTSAKAATRPCGNFTFFKFGMESPTSLFVTAGQLSGFSQLVQTGANPFIDTADAPYEGIGNPGGNSAWVTDQRKPKMTAQTVCATNAGGASTTVVFQWAPATDPYPADGSIGYMVIRNSSDDFPTRTQGVQYQSGQTIGSGNQQSTVIAIISSSQTVAMSHNPGEGTFYYRIFAFRYGNTPGFPGHSTRGRTYNTEDYVKVNTSQPIQVTLGNDTLCGPGIAALTALAPTGASVSWYTTATGGTPIATTDTLFQTVNQTRSFWVEVSAVSLCATQRFEVQAIIEPISVSYTAADSVCEGVPVLLQAAFRPGYTYQWLFQNVPAGATTTRGDSQAVYVAIPASQDRKWIHFSLQATNAEGCKTEVMADSLQTVPFNPMLVSDSATPYPGSVFAVTAINHPLGIEALGWSQTGGTLVSQTSQSCNVSTSDSIVVAASIAARLPDNNVFCTVNRSLKIYAREIVPVYTLKPIPNLLLTSGRSENKVLNFDLREVKQLEIFDRWGKSVFSTENYAHDWDGKDQTGGNYFFVAQVREPSKASFETITGWILLIK